MFGIQSITVITQKQFQQILHFGDKLKESRYQEIHTVQGIYQTL